MAPTRHTPEESVTKLRQLAAHFGLPYAFAAYFAPDMFEEVQHVYRTTLQPSDTLAEPYAVMAASVCAAESDEEAAYLRTSQLQVFANIVTNNRGKLPKPSLKAVAKMRYPVRAQVDRMLSCAAVGGPETLAAQIEAMFTRYQPDELMVTGMIHDQTVRLRSFEIAAEVKRGLV